MLAQKHIGWPISLATPTFGKLLKCKGDWLLDIGLTDWFCFCNVVPQGHRSVNLLFTDLAKI